MEKTKLIMRGFADTDGSLFFGKKGTYQKHVYPTIELKSASFKLLKQFKALLQNNGFTPHLRPATNRLSCFISAEKNNC